MSHPIVLQPSYILHARAYRDTSLLLEIFSLEHGRVGVVARGVKGPRSRFRGLLQPFVPLLLTWSGKTDLYSLQTAESSARSYDLRGEALLCGIYLNELIVKLLHRHDPHPGLFNAYQQALEQLAQTLNQQKILRQFEKKLLLELGYAIQMNFEADQVTPITPEKYYVFDPVSGFQQASCSTSALSNNHFHGESLLALHYDQLKTLGQLKDAKRLLRIALAHLLENKPIKSRELFFYQNRSDK